MQYGNLTDHTVLYMVTGLMNRLLIYQDYVHNNGSLFKALIRYFGTDRVAFIDAAELSASPIPPETAAFIMPGGASRYVGDKLKGPGNARIIDYVREGGFYVGICAGAYYACRQTIWKKGHTDEISVSNELAFFPGDAVGPIDQFTIGDNTAKIVHLDNGHQTFYWGGPLFHSNDNSFDILARYADLPGQPPAIVSGTFGKGRYLLFSNHPEIDNAQLDLMTFDVVQNRYADIAAINAVPGMTLDGFTAILKKYIA